MSFVANASVHSVISVANASVHSAISVTDLFVISVISVAQDLCDLRGPSHARIARS